MLSGIIDAFSILTTTAPYVKDRIGSTFTETKPTISITHNSTPVVEAIVRSVVPDCFGTGSRDTYSVPTTPSYTPSYTPSSSSSSSYYDTTYTTPSYLSIRSSSSNSHYRTIYISAYSSTSSSSGSANSSSATDSSKSGNKVFYQNITFENTTDLDIEFECEDKGYNDGSHIISARSKETIYCYSKFSPRLHPKFTMRVLYAGTVVLEEKRICPTPNEINWIKDDKISGKPKKRMDNVWSRGQEADYERKFRIKISEAVANYEEKEKQAKIRQKIALIQEKISVLQQKLFTLQGIEIPEKLQNSYERMTNKISSLLQDQSLTDDELSKVSDDKIDRINSLITESGILIEKVKTTNQRLEKESREQDIAEPIRKDLEKLESILEQSEFQYQTYDIKPEFQKELARITRETSRLLLYKNRSNSYLTDSVGCSVEKILDEAKNILQKVRREKSNLKTQKQEQQRIELLRDNIQKLGNLINSEAFNIPSPKIGHRLLETRKQIINEAKYILLPEHKHNLSLTKEVGVQVQKLVDRGRQYIESLNVELKNIEERIEKQILKAQKQEQQRIELLRDDIQKLDNLINSEALNITSPEIGPQLLEARRQIVNEAKYILPLKHKDNLSLTKKIGVQVQKLIDRGRQYIESLNVELENIEKRREMELSRQLLDLKESFKKLELSIQESKLPMIAKLRLVERIKLEYDNLFQVNVRKYQPLDNKACFSQGLFKRGQEFITHIRSEMAKKLSQSSISYSSRDDVRSPTQTHENNFNDQETVNLSRPGF